MPLHTVIHSDTQCNKDDFYSKFQRVAKYITVSHSKLQLMIASDLKVIPCYSPVKTAKATIN